MCIKLILTPPADYLVQVICYDDSFSPLIVTGEQIYMFVLLIENISYIISVHFCSQGLKGDPGPVGPLGPVGPKGNKVSESAITC